jgi:hypothetical protein
MLSRLWRAVTGAAAECNEAWERTWLLNHPWEEDFLHWVGDGEHRRLHGHVTPPANGRRYSVTRGGWCPGVITDRYPDAVASPPD